MLRKWLRNFIREEIEDSNCLQLRHEVMIQQFGSLAVLIQSQTAQLRRIEELTTLFTQKLEQERSPAHSSDERPLSTTRASWPRMKRYLEEREVRKVLDEQNAYNQAQFGARPDNMQIQRQSVQSANEQVDAVEQYWRNKQKG